MHFTRLLALGFGRATGLQAIHHVAHFRQHLLRLIARAGLRRLLHLAHHAFEIVLPELGLVIAGFLTVLVLLRLLGELLDVVVHRLPEFLHQFLQFLL